jgi:hypothetical protein
VDSHRQTVIPSKIAGNLQLGVKSSDETKHHDRTTYCGGYYDLIDSILRVYEVGSDAGRRNTEGDVGIEEERHEYRTVLGNVEGEVIIVGRQAEDCERLKMKLKGGEESRRGGGDGTERKRYDTALMAILVTSFQLSAHGMHACMHARAEP